MTSDRLVTRLGNVDVVTLAKVEEALRRMLGVPVGEGRDALTRPSKGLSGPGLPRKTPDVNVVRRLTCEWCGDEFGAPEAPSGRWRKYCRPAHRRRAYEARRLLREAQSEVPRLRQLLRLARVENCYLLEELRRLGRRSPFETRRTPSATQHARLCLSGTTGEVRLPRRTLVLAAALSTSFQGQQWRGSTGP